MYQPLRQAARRLYNLRRTHGQQVFQHALSQLTDSDLEDLLSCWQLYARDKQLRPANCKPIWLRSAGRGEGKTRCAAEDVLDTCEDWGPVAKGILASKTIGDVRKVMIEGESGLAKCAERRGYSIDYIANRGVVYHPSGAEMYLATSERPDQPRGLQCNFFWADEIASWMKAVETFNNIIFAWRLKCPGGKKGIVTTTPKPNPIMFLLMKDKTMSELVTVTKAWSRENAENLDPDTINVLEALFLGTKTGEQELKGELLDSFGAIIDQDTIHKNRVRGISELDRCIVSLDPSIDDKDDSDAAGIVVLGSDLHEFPHAYLLADYTLDNATFSKWARQSVIAFLEWNADCVVAEVNQGGSGIREAIEVAAAEISEEIGREVIVPVRSVWAKESKKARAEPVGALYERGRIHHVGLFEHCEKELTTWLPGMPSPNRMDAIVHGATHLLLGDKPGVGPIGAYYGD